MLTFVQGWFSSAQTSIIGVDFGSDSLRLAQVEPDGKDFHLIAAASADVPSHVRNDVSGKFNFFSETVRELLAQGSFKGKRVVLNLPASIMHIQHLRLPKMDEEALKKALPWEARGKLPFDPSQAVLRHLVAGEIYHDQEPKYEVVLMAARRDLVEQYLAAAAKAKLDVAGMNVEPKAMVDCFSHIFRRKTDADVSTCFVDIGCTATRAVIARGGRIQFARTIPIGGEHFSRAVSSALQIPLEQAKLLRVKATGQGPEEVREKQAIVTESRPKPPAYEEDPMIGTGFALLNAAVSAAQRRDASGPQAITARPQAKAEDRLSRQQSEAPSPAAHPERERIDQACREPLAKLIEELSLCRRYYEATFPNQPVQRLLFIGGEAHQRGLCQQIARDMGIAAQVGDPLARMGKFTQVGIESGIDRRTPQPGWTVALGLSMGPAPEGQAK